MSVAWSKPPDNIRARANSWYARLKPVMERPGEWALVGDWLGPDTAHGAARDMRNGRTLKPAGVWEFYVAKRDHGQYGIWARFLGDDGIATCRCLICNHDFTTAEALAEHRPLCQPSSGAVASSPVAAAPDDPST